MDTNKHEFHFRLIPSGGVVATSLWPVRNFRVKKRRTAAWLQVWRYGKKGAAVRDRRYSNIEEELVTDSLFRGLGMKRFSYLLIERVAFAFGCELFAFRLNVGFAFL